MVSDCISWYHGTTSCLATFIIISLRMLLAVHYEAHTALKIHC